MLSALLLSACGADRGGRTDGAGGSGPGAETSFVALPNGIYLLAPEDGSDASVASGGDRAGVATIPYRHDFLDSEEGEPDSVTIVPSERVLLELAAEPEGIAQPDERLTLLLSLTGAASAQLADFTERHLEEHVAIVIGGQAVTMHKVRARIEGGKLQITRCTDDACRQLLLELKDDMRVE